MIKFELSAYRRPQKLAYILGAAFGSLLLGIFLLPEYEYLHARGPMNTGHEDLRCESCHTPAEGTFRQRVQANVKYLIGRRQTPAAIGHEAADNFVCLDCHERPNDRHPVFRFNEPRFEEARKNIRPHLCTSCHLEHTGRRATIDPEYCVNCHEDTRLKNDPISISHEELIKSERWTTCLGCHDFHGNHVMETETDVARAFEPKQILDYFDGGASPYPDKFYYEAKEEASDER